MCETVYSVPPNWVGGVVVVCILWVCAWPRWTSNNFAAVFLLLLDTAMSQDAHTQAQIHTYVRCVCICICISGPGAIEDVVQCAEAVAWLMRHCRTACLLATSLPLLSLSPAIFCSADLFRLVASSGFLCHLTSPRRLPRAISSRLLTQFTLLCFPLLGPVLPPWMCLSMSRAFCAEFWIWVKCMAYGSCFGWQIVAIVCMPLFQLTCASDGRGLVLGGSLALPRSLLLLSAPGQRKCSDLCRMYSEIRVHGPGT